MDLAERSLENVLVVELLEKRLDAAVADSFKGRMVDLINQGASKLVVDFSSIEFMDSSGLAAVLSSYKSLSLSGGAFAVCGVGGALQSLFRLTKLDKVLRIYDTAEDASRALG